MSDTIVCGIDNHREWMLHVISCECVTGIRKDFMWFFNTRAEAETHLEKVAGKITNHNAIIKIIKVRAFEHLGLDFEQIEKES
jgi:hypothetical protein|nr:MAG TPA: hypothetical protein [Caudoviricetes sp.]